MFDRENYRAAVFRAGAEALHQPQRDQHDGRPDAGRLVSRQQADQESADANQHQRDDEYRLAPDPVAEVAEDHAAEGPREEAHTESCERSECPGGGFELGKEQLSEHQRSSHAIYEEVVPFQGRPDGRSHHDSAM